MTPEGSKVKRPVLEERKHNRERRVGVLEKHIRDYTEECLQMMQRKMPWLLLVPCVILLGTGEVSANPLPKEPDRNVCKEFRGDDGVRQTSQDCLNESDIMPCEAGVAKELISEIELQKRMLQYYGPEGEGRRGHAESTSNARFKSAQERLDKISGMSTLQYALSTPPYTPLYDLGETRAWIKDKKKALAILKSGDEQKIEDEFSRPLQGKDLDDALTIHEKFMCMLNVRLGQLTGKPFAKTTRAASGGASAAPAPHHKAADRDTSVQAAPAGSPHTPEHTLADLGALTGKSSQEALQLLTPALTAALGRSPKVATALAGLNVLNASSLQEALTILNPILTAATKKNPTASKALKALTALTSNAPEEAVAVLITILTNSSSTNPNVAKTLASLQALPQMAPDVQSAPSSDGPVKEGPYNGHGTKKWPDGQQYTGSWVNGNMHGQGTYTWPDGARYTGSWVNDKKQGQGSFIWPDGTRLEGTWQDDEHVSGTQIAPDGTRLEIVNGEVVQSPQADRGWQAIPTREGCRFITHTGDFFLGMKAGGEASNAAPVTWSGRCTPDNLIVGSGKLIYEYTLTLPVVGTSRQMRIEMTGTATDGMFQGASEYASFYHKTPPGEMVLEDLGDARNPSPFFFRNGCSHSVDSENHIDPEPFMGCVEAGGAAFRKSLKGAGRRG